MKIKRLREDSLMSRSLGMLARAVIRSRALFFYPQLLLAVVCILFTVNYLKFDTTRENLVGANMTYHLNYRKFKKEFPTQDDLVVVVESENPEKNRQFVERLGRKLEAAKIKVPVKEGSSELVETNLFKDVFYKGDLKMLGNKALLFVPEDDLRELKKMLESYRPFI